MPDAIAEPTATPPATPPDSGAGSPKGQEAIKTSKPPVEPLSFVERMTGVKPPAKPAAAPAKPAAPAPAKPKAAAPKPLTPPPVDIDYERMAEAAGRGAAAALAKAQPGTGAAGAAAPTEPFNDKQKRTIEVLKRMEQEYPSNAGKANLFAESVKKAVEYQKLWESRHPGEAFDPDDDEHSAFFDSNEVDWDEDEYADTLALIRAEKVAEKASAAITPKLQEMDRREKLRAVEPMIVAQQISAARSFWSELGDEFKGVLDAHGSIVMPEVERLKTEDPTREVAFQAAQNVESFAAELHKLTLEDANKQPLYPYDPRNQAHVFIADFIADREAAMQALPPEQQIDANGRKFAPADEYFAMSEHRRKYYWRFTDADLSRLYAAQQADAVKAHLARENEKFEKTASARGYAKNSDGGKPATPPAGAAEPATPAPRATPPSPAGTVEPLVAPRPGSSRNGNDSATSSFLNRWMGRS